MYKITERCVCRLFAATTSVAYSHSFIHGVMKLTTNQIHLKHWWRKIGRDSRSIVICWLSILCSTALQCVHKHMYARTYTSTYSGVLRQNFFSIYNWEYSQCVARREQRVPKRTLSHIQSVGIDLWNEVKLIINWLVCVCLMLLLRVRLFLLHTAQHMWGTEYSVWSGIFWVKTGWMAFNFSIHWISRVSCCFFCAS